MADSPAQIAAYLANLKKARNTGVLTVKHGETLTTFRSLAEIKAIIADLEKDLAAANGTSKRRLRYMYQSGKGL
ncbi:MAG: hypothetical protein E5Y10_22845 [Mesorhizobium sp.]|uniref:phage head-tail joining protein n=1 Tax=Mesorhizobium sp. TaxID=1871066 RepID=UPI00121853E3|nr:hypothetical protein [Mesorhizobium sp.]TIN41382.1 MAG: hypothetical protein E5Y13_05700 [Mesorhizobium sp.]TJU86160.1 MAG: hypothetical protein E5Y10_22845 [Mesorhizobium sp.]